MRRAARLVAGILVATGLLVGGGTGGARAGEGERVAWFESVTEARRVAARTGRPLLLALHWRPVAASPQAAARLAAWGRLYRDPRVVVASRAYVCVLRLAPPPEGIDPDDGETPAVTHLVLDRQHQVLVRADRVAPGAQDAEAAALVRLMRQGLRAFGPIPADAPVIDRVTPDEAGRGLEGASPLHPVAVALDAPGLRLRLRWTLPAPALAGDDGARVEAGVRMRWDGAGPFALAPIAFEAGDELDLPVDVRFDDLEGLAPLLTEGTHRLDLYLEPRPGGYPFSRGPLHVGRVWVELGEGGGGGGSSDPQPDEREPPPAEPPPPQPAPEPGAAEPEPPPESDRTEVVEPFVREGETIRKEDAVVAVEDPDGAVKPPRRIPLEQALREFEKLEERAVGREGFAPRDQAFLRRYFDALRRAVTGGGR